MNDREMSEKLVTAVRMLSVEEIEKANSGHPGLPLGVSPMACELWLNHMRHNPEDPKWFNRDRFILSAGHGSSMMYALLHMFGYGISQNDLANFRQFGSITPGHPEYGVTPGIDASTGPLGQGIAMACGMAMAEKHLAAIYNTPDYKIIDHYTYVICGDGDLMEGVSAEASSLAGTMKLGKVIILYDSNRITIEGSTDLAFTEDVAKRYEAYDFEVLQVGDGNDMTEIGKAISQAQKNLSQPSLIIVNTKIGFGSPKEGTSAVHGAPLGKEAMAATRQYYGWQSDQGFKTSEDLNDFMQQKIKDLAAVEAKWQKLFDEYQHKYPEKAARLSKAMHDEYDLTEESLLSGIDKDDATRAISNKVQNNAFQNGVELFGGSADLGPSNKTQLQGEDSFSDRTPAGSNVHFGVREFAMAAMANGVALHGGARPYCATFLVFSDYLKPAVRLSCLMQLPVIYIFTHDSIGVGEDGPTHQPVEQITMLRSIPGLTVIRPAGRYETAAAWRFALAQHAPVALILSRQNMASDRTDFNAVQRGAYISADAENFSAVIMASGSELEPCLKAHDLLLEKGIRTRVVSVPSMEIFRMQTPAYIESVIPAACKKRVAVEAAASLPWYRLAGIDGLYINMNEFGLSAPGGELFAHYGFTAEKIAKAVADYVQA